MNSHTVHSHSKNRQQYSSNIFFVMYTYIVIFIFSFKYIRVFFLFHGLIPELF